MNRARGFADLIVAGLFRQPALNDPLNVLFHQPDPRGFSMLELVIVVAIMGVIAAIAVPRFGDQTERALVAATQRSQSRLNDAIERYAAEHHGEPPDAASLADQLTRYTDADGNTSPTRTPPFIYGPYLQEMPAVRTGPNRGSKAVSTSDNTPSGWVYDRTAGRVSPNMGGGGDAE